MERHLGNHEDSPAPVPSPVANTALDAPSPTDEVTPKKRKKSSEPRSRKTKSKISYSNKGFCSLMSKAGIEPVEGMRAVARSRVYSSETGSYGIWQVHRVKSVHGGEVREFGMRGGGCIKFFSKLVPMVKEAGEEMKNHFKSLKQYKVRECGDEPRLHALFTSTGSGYQYGRVQMEGNALSSLPVISMVAKRLATKFKLKNNEWNIGCHLVLYRSGKDSIGWHADDTQGEDVVASLTVNGPTGNARTICFQPASSPEDGDQQLELFPMIGDVYTMDKRVQEYYVHAMMKTKEPNEENCNFQRMSIIFRNGEAKTCKDNGWHVEDCSPSKPNEYVFGNMTGALQEGECYSRGDLLKCLAHVNRQGNIAGNMLVGCPSIIVKNLATAQDEDQYHFLTYVASDKSHPLTLLKSFSSQKPIRVFRSSSGNREKGKYFPIPSENKVVYRYDGIYYVVATINKKNGEFVGIGGEVVDARVFFLVRMEPSVIMQRLRMEHPSLNLCLPLLDEHDSSGYSGRDSTEIVDAAWDAKAFHEWNPLGTRI